MCISWCANCMNLGNSRCNNKDTFVCVEDNSGLILQSHYNCILSYLVANLNTQMLQLEGS